MQVDGSIIDSDLARWFRRLQLLEELPFECSFGRKDLSWGLFAGAGFTRT